MNHKLLTVEPFRISVSESVDYQYAGPEELRVSFISYLSGPDSDTVKREKKLKRIGK